MSSLPQASFQDDVQLVRACLNDDQNAWGELVDRYQRLVFSIPRRMGLTSDEADEVFQEVFVSLVRQLPQLRDARSLPKWLITTARRLSVQQIRKSRSRNEVELNHELPSEPVDDVLEWERRCVIDESLTQLDDRCRELLQALFRGSERPDYELIAREFDMPVGSIGPTRARCLEKLCTLVRERLDDEPRFDH